MRDASATDSESGIASTAVYVNEQPIYQVAGGALSFGSDSGNAPGFNSGDGIRRWDAFGNFTTR